MPPLLILVISMWLIRLPFAEVLSARYGAEAIWWSFPLGSVVSVLLALAYYRYGCWRHAHMLSAQVRGMAPDTGMATPAMSRVAPDEQA